jgi:glycosyltransferase involved in cell wall biosynthesis
VPFLVADFTVIIPTYNEARNIENTLRRVRAQQTRASFEIVVVDGGSVDKTVAIAKKYAKVLNSPKKGKAYQLNYAAAQTTSKFIIFLDADTLLPWNYIERVKKSFERDHDLWACSGPIFYTGRVINAYYLFVLFQACIDFFKFSFYSCIWFLLQRLPDAQFKLLQPSFFYNISMVHYYSLRQLFGSPEFSGSNICVRRKIFEKIGGFRQPPRMGVDRLFCTVLRSYIRKEKRGKMKLIYSLVVETDVRNLEFVRSLKRIKTYREFA